MDAAKQRQGKKVFFKCMNEMEGLEVKDGDRGAEGGRRCVESRSALVVFKCLSVL